MADGQERRRRGEIADWEGAEGEADEGRGGWCERPSGGVDAPLPDEGRLVENQRGSAEGIMRSGSGSGRSVERAARKEVRWSKDVDYEG